MKIHVICFHQHKRFKIDISLSCDLVVELAHGAAAQVPWVLILGIHILDLFIDALEIGVFDHCLAPQDELPLVGDLQRNVGKHPGVIGDNLADLAIAPCNCLRQLPVFIGQYDRQTVQLPGQDRFLAAQPSFQFVDILCLVQGQHGPLVPLSWKPASNTS